MEEIKIASDGRKRIHVLISCNYCKNDFWKQKRFVKKNNFCSKNCKSLSARNRIDVICAGCKKQFQKTPYKASISKSGLVFCSRKCKDKSQRVEFGLTAIWPEHFGLGGGKYQYRQKAIEAYGHKCELCGWDKTVDVHHIDGDRSNNKLSNLCVLCPNCHSLTETNKYVIEENVIVETENKIKKLRATCFLE